MSSVEVLEATNNTDLPDIFHINPLAFRHNEPFWDLTYPSHSTPTGHQTGTHRLLQKKPSDPILMYSKAVSPTTKKIVGMARWHICNGQAPPEKEYLLPGGNPGYEEETWEQYKKLSDAFMEDRNRAIKAAQGRIVVLDVLAVDPGFQGNGVGRKLVEWGCRRADELGVEVVVESSKEGRGFYEKCGFVWVRDVVVRVDVEGWGEQESAWMVRSKREKGGGGRSVEGK